MTICCVCIFFFLMCAFFVDASHAAGVARGTTTKKEQTIKLNLSAGTALITVSDADSWVYAQLQLTGENKLGTAVNGDTLLAELGQKKTFTVPVRKAGAYYLYLHGTNSGAAYSVQQIAAGGKLKSGTPRLGTSYADNRTIAYYTIHVSAKGKLRVTATDASYRYPGYSKITLKKKGKLYSGEEYLFRGMGYSTVYGVKKGTYQIGVRSSSELYKITATFTEMKTLKYGKTKKEAAVIERKTKARGIVLANNKVSRWYKITLPQAVKKGQKGTITVKASNNNRSLNSGFKATLLIKKSKKGSVKRTAVLNNSSYVKSVSLFKTKTRDVYVKVYPKNGTTGTYMITWK